MVALIQEKNYKTECQLSTERETASQLARSLHIISVTVLLYLTLPQSKVDNIYDDFIVLLIIWMKKQFGIVWATDE